MDIEQLKYLLVLKQIKGLKSSHIMEFFSVAGSYKDIFNLKREDFAKLKATPELIYKLKNADINSTLIQKEIEFIAENKIEAVDYFSDKYPAMLRFCNDAPMLFFAKGNSDFQVSNPFISIVGTRDISQYGIDATNYIIEALAPYKPVIVSGLASGVDGAAHRAALKFNLKTIGVLGCGFPNMYPAENRDLASQMCLQEGAVITEYLSNTPARPQHFPVRNRIVAGMSLATIVIEAKKGGGALITANLALGYNRELFAVPGSVFSAASQGCNTLISENKAISLDSPDRLISELALTLDSQTTKKTQEKEKQIIMFADISEEEKPIYDIISSKDKIHIDEIAYIINTPVHKISSVLLNMELKGAIEALPAKYYRIPS